MQKQHTTAAYKYTIQNHHLQKPYTKHHTKTPSYNTIKKQIQKNTNTACKYTIQKNILKHHTKTPYKYTIQTKIKHHTKNITEKHHT